jgi:hypothetical protein
MVQLLKTTQRVLLFAIWQLVVTIVMLTYTLKHLLTTMMVVAQVIQCTALAQVRVML